MQEAREKQALILKEATATREAIVSQAHDKARQEASRLISDAKIVIENEKQKALRDIRNQMAELSINISEKILRNKLSSSEVQMDYINRLLDNVSSSNNKSN